LVESVFGSVYILTKLDHQARLPIKLIHLFLIIFKLFKVMDRTIELKSSSAARQFFNNLHIEGVDDN
jgi:hypothetical protein